MDINFISKPWRRLLFTSKYYARKHFADIYNINSVQYSSNCDKATINMSEYGNTIQISPISHGTTNFEKSAIENSINNNNVFRENLSNVDSIISTNTNDNELQLVTTKLLNSPKKGTVKFLNLNNSDILHRSGLDDVQIIKESGKSNQTANTMKNSLIKIKVKFIKDKDVKGKNNQNSAPLVEIKDNSFQDNEQINVPELNVNAELYATNNCDNKFRTCENNTHKVEQHEDILDKVIPLENLETVVLKENKSKISAVHENSIPKIVIAEKDITEVPRPQMNIYQFFMPEEDNNCIFVENKSRPLSPIQTSSPASLQFQAVEDLIQYHESKVHQNNPRRSLSPKSLPRMGTNALFKNKTTDEKSPLSDPEIISAMVRDRFIVNMYESRGSKQQKSIRKSKASTFGRIYRSLEKAVATPNKNEELSCLKNYNNHIIRIQQSSPIKLEDQHVSFNSKQNYTKQISLDENDLFGNSTRHFFNLEEESTFQNKLDEMAQKVLVQNEIMFNKFGAENNRSILQEEKECGLTEEQCVVIDFYEEYVSNSTLAEEQDGIIYPQNHYSDIKKENNSDNLTAESYEQVEKPSDSITTTGIESSYNMEEFLEKALGEELNKYDSQIDSTNEAESNKNVPTLPESNTCHQEDSICTSDASDLISKINTFQSNFYRSLTKKLQHMTDSLRLSSVSKHDLLEGTVNSDDLEIVFPNNERVSELVRQAAVQYEAMKQITKALAVCRNTKEFAISSEQVEGERLLLVASYKRQAILDEIRRLDYEVENHPPNTETGSLLISDVTLPLKEDSTEAILARRDHNKWYVCIFSFGPHVFATQPTMTLMNKSVRFPEEILFSELPSDFSINMEVFCLLQRRTGRNFSHESKFHINKDVKKTHCPSAKNFLQREKQAQKNPARYDTGVRTSSFKPCGSLQIRVGDLSKTNPWYMRKVPLCSVLNGSISMTLKSTVKIQVFQAGFLTVGTMERGSLAWNRRWCVLQGHLMKYWNYPCNEDACDPLKIIDLKYCPVPRIDIVDRSLCARPRTLIVESYSEPKTKKSNIFSLERYFFSADNNSDLHDWEAQFNIVVRALRTWNARFVN